MGQRPLVQLNLELVGEGVVPDQHQQTPIQKPVECRCQGFNGNGGHAGLDLCKRQGTIDSDQQFNLGGRECGHTTAQLLLTTGRKRVFIEIIHLRGLS